jgi:hypothetical protein
MYETGIEIPGDLAGDLASLAILAIGLGLANLFRSLKLSKNLTRQYSLD